MARLSSGRGRHALESPLPAPSAGTREAAAELLSAWLDTDPADTGDSDVMILVDIHSVAMEGVIIGLEADGYTKFMAESGGGGANSDLELAVVDHRF